MPLISFHRARRSRQECTSDIRVRVVLSLLICAAFLGTFSISGYSAEFYVSPNGSPTGDGSASRPWDLHTALAHPDSVRPGDTIWLRGGVYRGKFASRLKGMPGFPIVVRTRPGEWATIDGHRPLALLNRISAGDLVAHLSDASRLAPGRVLHVNGEDLSIKSLSGNVASVVRGWNGSTPAPHDAGSPILVKGHILVIGGEHTWYWGFEVMSSDPARVTSRAGSSPVDITRGNGIVLTGTNNKLINLVVHDAADAIGYPRGSNNNEIYGCILFYTGWQGPDRGHGHGIYIQSNRGTRHLVREVISFNNFATGMKAFGMAAPAEDVVFDGVISFNNGSIRLPEQNKETNLYVGTDQTPSDEIQITNSFLYHTPGIVGENLHLGYSVPRNGGVLVKQNYIIGGHAAMDLNRWAKATVTGNTFHVASLGRWSSQSLIIARAASGSGKSDWSWNDNTYIDESPPFNNGQRYTFGFAGLQNSLGGGMLSFEEWKRGTGFDSDSKYLPAPSGTKVFVRRNEYEPGRAHIVALNWDFAESVTADLRDVLRTGDEYEVYDVQNLFGPPVVAGSYSNVPISLPMKLETIVRPVGNVPSVPAHTAPRFAVFLVVLKSRGEGPAGASPRSRAPALSRFERSVNGASRHGSDVPKGRR